MLADGFMSVQVEVEVMKSPVAWAYGQVKAGAFQAIKTHRTEWIPAGFV
jgi:hypothetical protein